MIATTYIGSASLHSWNVEFEFGDDFAIAFDTPLRYSLEDVLCSSPVRNASTAAATRQQITSRVDVLCNEYTAVVAICHNPSNSTKNAKEKTKEACLNGSEGANSNILAALSGSAHNLSKPLNK